MKKSILNLKGAQELSKSAQKSVLGGQPGPIGTGGNLCPYSGGVPMSEGACHASDGVWHIASSCCYYRYK